MNALRLAKGVFPFIERLISDEPTYEDLLRRAKLFISTNAFRVIWMDLQMLDKAQFMTCGSLTSQRNLGQLISAQCREGCAD
jgi:hypothetical protein